ncbi:tetratricopeptide repeat protein [Dokdonella sp.]|uniref:tetratricopeptide repeat protein n=1 Tax=Dokdonella sp. TaxID=2291710 RepID=UPI003C425829
MSLFAELKRRNVIRMAGLYLVGAWMLVQVAETVLPVFDVPNWMLRAIMIVMALGFVPALIFAWIFEITPEGIRRDHEVDRTRSIAPKTGQRMNIMIASLLSIGLAWYVLDKFVFSPTRDALNVAASLKPIEPAAEAESTIDAHSIAVLPFENLSEEKANAYFADGIQDEILTTLAKIGDLTVISRTSTKSYDSRPDNLPQIARDLGVANIVEGSVQKSGNRVRVIVQLIHAESDSHLWAETYDRTLDDIFAVQSEVARKIADSLSAKLTSDERATLANKPTNNPEAYDAYLRGLAMNAQGFEVALARKAALAFAEAVRLDPDFALAWAELTTSAGYLYFNGVDPDRFTSEYVKQAADNAFRLQPELIEAQLAQGVYRYNVLRDFADAEAAFEVVLERAPNNPAALFFTALAERRQDKWEEALEHFEKAAHRDPRNVGLMVVIGGESLRILRRWEEAHQWLDRALAIEPNSTLALFYKIDAYQTEGRLEEAARLLDQIPQAGEDPQIAVARSRQFEWERRDDAIIAELEPLLQQPDSALNGFGPALTISLAQALQRSGRDTQARETFQRLVDRIGPDPASQVDDSVLPVIVAQANAGLGNLELALKQAKEALELYRNDAYYRVYAQVALAQVLALAGENEAAIAGLTELLDVPAGVTPAGLRYDRGWDPLREDPAFQALLEDSPIDDAPDA